MRPLEPSKPLLSLLGTWSVALLSCVPPTDTENSDQGPTDSVSADSGTSDSGTGEDPEDSGTDTGLPNDDPQNKVLRVLSLNAWRDGTGALSNSTWSDYTYRLASLIQKSGADIVGYQEAMTEAPVAALAAELGFHYEYRGSGGYEAVLSRYPIVGTFDIPGIHATGDSGSQGTEIRIAPDETVVLVNAYQYWGAYGPYEVRDNLQVSEEKLILNSKISRANHIEFDILPSIDPYLKAKTPVFMTGDFNEPSHLDWSVEAAEAGWNYGRSVEWQSSKILEDAGFIDSYREVVPLDPAHYDSRGETWVRHGLGYDLDTEPLDRIDFVYSSGDSLIVLESKIVGEVLPQEEEEAHGVTIDLALPSYRPDHRSVVSAFEMPTSLSDEYMTALTFEGLTTNSEIPEEYGSKVSTPEPGIVSAGTPNIEVTWLASGGYWQFYNDGEWSAAQMDQYGVDNPFDIVFTSDEGWGVVVESFVFDDYATYETGNQFVWTLYEESADGTVIATGVGTTSDGQNLTVFTGMTEAHSGTVLLRIVEHSSDVSPSVTDQAIDSIVFSQHPTVAP